MDQKQCNTDKHEAMRELRDARLKESLASLDRGKADMDAGRTRPAREALREIARELGIKTKFSE